MLLSNSNKTSLSLPGVVHGADVLDVVAGQVQPRQQRVEVVRDVVEAGVRARGRVLGAEALEVAGGAGEGGEGGDQGRHRGHQEAGGHRRPHHHTAHGDSLDTRHLIQSRSHGASS